MYVLIPLLHTHEHLSTPPFSNSDISAGEVSNLDPSICTPAKVEEYRSECADIMERAGMKKSHQKMTGEMESKVREMMKVMEPNFSADKMAKVMEGGEFDAQDLWENMGKFEL